MTLFSQQLGAFLARQISFADLEQAADDLVDEGIDTVDALHLVNMHFEAGRLPKVLHRVLVDRLTERLPVADDPLERTQPVGDDKRQSRDTEVTTPMHASDVVGEATSRADITAPYEQPDSAMESTQPLDESAEAENTAAQSSADDTAADMPAKPSDRTAKPAVGKRRGQIKTEWVAASTADPTRQMSVDATRSLASAPETTTPPDRTTDDGALPGQTAEAAIPDPTLRVNQHVAPTVQLNPDPSPEQPAVPVRTHDKTLPIADVPHPNDVADGTLPIDQVPPPSAPADATLAIADVPPPTAPADATLPISEVPPPSGHSDATLPIEQVPPPQLGVNATQVVEPGQSGAPSPMDSGVFPSKQFPTGTGSNWLNPEQWSPRHAGPLGPGSLLKQRFLIEKQLGRGGMGVVFKARDKRKDEAQDRDPFVAIKVLNDNFRDHPQALIALQREARKAQTLAHPNIVTVYDFDRDGTTVYMTMELMRGEPLDLILKKHKDVGVDHALARSIVKEMAAGLAYAHKLDIIHSDFKPGNVFLPEDNRVKILDFGIARATAYSGNTQTEDTLFDAGDLGSLTPGYAAYEMFHKGAPHPADDVYALAITAYLLFTGKHPFNRKTADEVVTLGLEPEPSKGLERHEWRAIERGLALKREDRTVDAATFLREFEGRRKLARWATAAIACLALLAVFFGYQSMQAPGPAIPWTELTPQQRTEFRSFVESGDEWLANDPPFIDGAFNDFAQAWEIHPRNPAAPRGLDAVARLLIDDAADAITIRDKRDLLEGIEIASANEYLDGHPELRRLRRQLAAEVNASE